MSSITALRSSLKPRLDAIHDMVVKALASDNPLMNQVVSHHLSHRGKELRPMLTLVTADLLGGRQVYDVKAPAAAIEILHNASLIHDDVVDASATRHGVETINAIWDNHIAVLVGDFFVSRSLGLAVYTGDLKVIRTLSDLGGLLSLGEMDQIYNARSHSLTREGYFDIITHKTAALFTACVEAGAYSVGVTDHRLELLKRFATIFGQCFQITDDIFDYFPSEILGKPTGNDLREGKVTLPLLAALASDHPRAAEMAAKVQADTLDDATIAELIAFAIEAGGIEEARRTLAELRAEGARIAHEIAPDVADNPLVTMLDFVLEREK